MLYSLGKTSSLFRFVVRHVMKGSTRIPHTGERGGKRRGKGGKKRPRGSSAGRPAGGAVGAALSRRRCCPRGGPQPRAAPGSWAAPDKRSPSSLGYSLVLQSSARQEMCVWETAPLTDLEMVCVGRDLYERLCIWTTTAFLRLYRTNPCLSPRGIR